MRFTRLYRLVTHVYSGLMSAADKVKLDGLGSASTHADGDYEHVANKAVAGGYASLDGGGKVPVGQLPAAVVGGVDYFGTWDASTNSPHLASGVGVKGQYYLVSAPGNTNLDGVAAWLVGDWAVFDGAVWEHLAGSAPVRSVAGRTGDVTLTTADVPGPIKVRHTLSLFPVSTPVLNTDEVYSVPLPYADDGVTPVNWTLSRLDFRSEQAPVAGAATSTLKLDGVSILPANLSIAANGHAASTEVFATASGVSGQLVKIAPGTVNGSDFWGLHLQMWGVY